MTIEGSRVRWRAYATKWASAGVGAPGATAVGMLGQAKSEVIYKLVMSMQEVWQDLQISSRAQQSLHDHRKDRTGRAVASWVQKRMPTTWAPCERCRAK